jgi:hypothetical protein
VATVIDSLVISLGLDTSGLDQGQRDAVSKLRQLESSTQAHIKPVEAGFNQLIGTFKEFQTRLLGIAGLVAGGLGLDRLVGDIAKVNAQTGYLATSLGQTNTELTRLQATARLMGQSPEDATATAVAIANNAASFSYGQGSSLRRLAGSYPGLNTSLDQLQRKFGPNAPTHEILMALSKFATQEEKDPNRARFALGQVGLPQGAINMALQGPDAIKKAWQEAGPFAVTPEQLKNLQALNIEFNKLMLSVERLTRSLASSPELLKFLEALTRIVDAFTKGGVVGAVKQLDEETKYDDPKNSMWETFKKSWRWIQRRAGVNVPDDVPDEGVDSGKGGGHRALAKHLGLDKGHTPTNAPAHGTSPASAQPTGALSRQNNSPISGNLATQREHLIAEMNANPRLKNFAINAMQHEGGVQSNLEQLTNYALMHHMSINQALHSGQYGPVNRGIVSSSPASRSQLAAFDRVAGGSNMTDYATDQGMAGDPNFAKYMANRSYYNMHKVEGAWFSYHGDRGRNWAQRQREADRRDAAATAATPTHGQGRPVLIQRHDDGDGIGGTQQSSFENWRNLGLGLQRRSFDNLWKNRTPTLGPTSSTTNSSATHIGSMHVTVPEGSSPKDYADGISDHLQRVAPVYHSLTGMV